MEENKPLETKESIAQSEDEALLTLYKRLIEYKNNLFKIDTLISLEKDIDTITELRALKNNLVEAISYQEETIKQTQKSEEFIYSTERVEPHYVDRVCKGWFEKDKRWYHAHIDEVDIERQEVNVSWVGYKLKSTCHAIYVRVLPIPEATKFQPGTNCEALYPEDGKYYSCVIEKITEAGYYVKFKKYNNKEVISLFYLREPRQNPNSLGKRGEEEFENMIDFKVPDYLRVLPNDSLEERNRKKKKIKHLKQRWKSSLIEKDLTGKLNKWGDFNVGAKDQKKGHFMIKKNQHSIFKSPDTIDGKVGVMGSGKGMTNFSQKERYNLNDNSYMWRDFN